MKRQTELAGIERKAIKEVEFVDKIRLGDADFVIYPTVIPREVTPVSQRGAAVDENGNLRPPSKAGIWAEDQ